MEISLQTISIIIMAAGDSVRFCNHDSDSTDSYCSNIIQTKKQWLRIGSTPLWLIVANKLAKKCLKFCCNKDLLRLFIESGNNFTNHTSQSGLNSIDSNYTTRDIKKIIESLLQNNKEYKAHIEQILQKPMLEQIIIAASPKDRAYMQKLLPSAFRIQINHHKIAKTKKEMQDFVAKTSYPHSITNVKNNSWLESTKKQLSQNATLEIKMQVVQGGNSRYSSLQNALDIVDSNYVLVNDCARCNVKKSVLSRLFASLAQNKYDCIAPYLPINDTTIYINQTDTKEQKYSHIDRNAIRLIQTPQISRTASLKESKKLNQNFRDETSAICAIPNTSVMLVLGDLAMNKITTNKDIFLLKKLYKSSQNSNLNVQLVGIGSDIHAFEDSKEMWLCGVKIESSFGLKAHSDGDVGIHAIIDSILGAMCYGDIGEIFPDTDSTFKNIDSKILLRNVYEYCLSVGLEIGNLDITIIAQIPRISPYKSKMQESLAKILYLQKSQVNIKASTAEKLGFVGRKEGILVQCIATLQPRVLPK